MTPDFGRVRCVRTLPYQNQENILKRPVTGAWGGSNLPVERWAVVILRLRRVLTLAGARILALVGYGAVEKAAPAHTGSHHWAAASPIPETIKPGTWLSAWIHEWIIETSRIIAGLATRGCVTVEAGGSSWKVGKTIAY